MRRTSDALRSLRASGSREAFGLRVSLAPLSGAEVQDAARGSEANGKRASVLDCGGPPPLSIQGAANRFSLAGFEDEDAPASFF
jgi:hypothetical protein